MTPSQTRFWKLIRSCAYKLHISSNSRFRPVYGLLIVRPSVLLNNRTHQRQRRSIFVGNIPLDIQQDTLEKYFSVHGEIAKTTVIVKQHKAYAFILFKDPINAERAINQSKGLVLEGRAIQVKWAYTELPMPTLKTQAEYREKDEQKKSRYYDQIYNTGGHVSGTGVSQSPTEASAATPVAAMHAPQLATQVSLPAEPPAAKRAHIDSLVKKSVCTTTSTPLPPVPSPPKRFGPAIRTVDAPATKKTVHPSTSRPDNGPSINKSVRDTTGGQPATPPSPVLAPTGSLRSDYAALAGKREGSSGSSGSLGRRSVPATASAAQTSRDKMIARRIRRSHGVQFLGPDDDPHKDEIKYWNCRNDNDNCLRCGKYLNRDPKIRKEHYECYAYDVYFYLCKGTISELERWTSRWLGKKEKGNRVCIACSKHVAGAKAKEYFETRKLLLLHLSEYHRHMLSELKKGYAAKGKNNGKRVSDRTIHNMLAM